MSFARFGHDSDVYVYASNAGYDCCMCHIHGQTRSYATRRQIIRHLHVHETLGHRVPKYTRNLIAIHAREEQERA